MNYKIPKIVLGIPIIIISAIITQIAIESTDTETFTSIISTNTEFEKNLSDDESEIFSNNLYSGHLQF